MLPFHPDDIAFAKVVTDTLRTDYILIGGTIIGLQVGDVEMNNQLVDLFVSGLRRSGGSKATAGSSGVVGPVKN